jgi:hypothetical protein
MRYKGKIGEFKWWAFLFWISACLAIAVCVYRHLSFKTIPQSTATVKTDDSARMIKEIQTEVEDCKVHILALEQQIKPQAPKRSSK